MSKLYCVISMGDSITGSAACYPFKAFSLTSRGDSTTAAAQATATYTLPGNIVFRNMAVSGTRLSLSTDNMTTVAQDYVDPLITTKSIIPTSGTGGAARPTRKYILTLLAGSNDGCLASASVATFVANVVAFCAARKAAGFDKVILGTVLPRSDVAGPLNEANRLTYNATITAPGWAEANGIDGIFDFGSHAIMGVKANNTDTTYYSDLIHPTSAGHELLAPIWQAKLDEVIATL